MSEHVLDQQNQGSNYYLLHPDQAHANYGLWGDSSSGVGVLGSSDGIVGVGGHSQNNVGVVGTSETNIGVIGISNGDNFGVMGTGLNAGIAAFNRTPNNNNQAYLASGCCAAYFVGDVAIFGNVGLNGDVNISGKLRKSSGGFLIDHPLDPDTKQFSHSFVESSEMKNIYDGIAILDANGEAVVELPGWFETLNTNFRYQLTAIGIPGPNLHIVEEISNGRFKIAGGTSSMKVSWQVTGVRQDAWAKAHPMLVEEEKSLEERGHYLHPELYGASKEKSIERIRHPQPVQPTP